MGLLLWITIDKNFTHGKVDHMRFRPAASFATALVTAITLSACGSSSANDAESADDTPADEPTEVIADDSNEASASPSGSANGTGSVTVDGNTFNFDLQCAFDAETLNAQVSISIKGTGNDGIELAFTQMWGVDLSTAQLSPDVPPAHSISIYEMPGVTQVYSYDSISDKVLDVSGKTVSGTVMFFEYENGETVGFQPSLSGDVNLQCD